MRGRQLWEDVVGFVVIAWLLLPGVLADAAAVVEAMPAQVAPGELPVVETPTATPGDGVDVVLDLVPAGDASVEELLKGTTAIEQLSLESFLATETQVASKKTQKVREAPGVITVFTREEIAAIGARDLLDVLALVPGFVPAQDSQGSISVGFRGLWSNDGRHLVLVDGQEMNEPFYTNVRMNYRLPMEQIERIEIVRGPGSAVYGGYAELAVINIITRSAANQTGIVAVSTVGVFDRVDSRRIGVSLAYANKFKELGGLETSVALFSGKAHQSLGVYQDQYGVRYRMIRENSQQEPLFANLGLAYQGLSLRFIYDGYQTYLRDMLDSSTAKPYRLQDLGRYFEARYEAKVASGLTITPRITIKRQQPWRVTDPSLGDYYMKTADRYLGNVTVSYDALTHAGILKDLNLLGGVEIYDENAKLDAPAACDDTFQCPFLDFHDPPNTDGKQRIHYRNQAVFLQGLAITDYGSLTLGGRAENHSIAGTSVVPRAAYTLVAGPVHAKLMASQAFRAPGIENINIVPTQADGTPYETKPEKTTVFEVEAGYQIADIAWVTANAFDITIHDPISYYFDPVTGSEGYKNFDKTGSRGIELEARVREKHGFLTLGYSFYTAAGKNTVPQYAVPTSMPSEFNEGDLDNKTLYRQNVLLGWPQHKITAYGGVELFRDLWVSGSLLFLSKRYGYASATLAADQAIDHYNLTAQDPALLLSAFVTYRNLGMKGMNVAAGVHNLTDERWRYVEGYDGGHAPSPAPSREYLLRLSFDEGAFTTEPQ